MFFVSLAILLFSSYFFLSAFLKSKNNSAFLYFLLIIFSQIISTFEILSLFKFISMFGVLVCNVIFLLFSIVFFLKEGKNFYIPKNEFPMIFSTLKKDKILLILEFCFVIFLCYQIFSILFNPINFGDALSYYLTRCTQWIENGCISHFITPDTRELIMPINMDFLYTWFLLFNKNEIGIGIFSFISYICLIYVVYNFLKELKFSIKRRLWSIFVFSSFSLVIVEMITPCADLFTGALILSSIYLFFTASKYKDKIALYFSSLSFALALGVKTTAVIALPSVFIIIFVINFLYKKNYLLKFISLLTLNFIIFSSYNYILNIIQFLNPISSSELYIINQFDGGLKGYFTNIIKYFFAIFDMSGMPEFININGLIEYWQTLFLSLFDLDIKMGTSKYFTGYFVFNNEINMINTSLGFMGLLAFSPSIIYSIKRGFKTKSKTSVIMAVLAFSIVFNIFLFSGLMIFTSYNMRYVFTFIIIASPIIAYSYPLRKHKYYRIFLSIIILNYFLYFLHNNPIYKIEKEENAIYSYFQNKQPEKIALIINQSTAPVYYIEKLRFIGFHIDKILLENIEKTDFNKYSYIITNKNSIETSNIVNFEERIKYPDLFIAKCIYFDKYQNIVQNTKNKPVMATCETPFEYLKEKGFRLDDNVNLYKYIIFKKVLI